LKKKKKQNPKAQREAVMVQVTSQDRLRRAISCLGRVGDCCELSVGNQVPSSFLWLLDCDSRLPESLPSPRRRKRDSRTGIPGKSGEMGKAGWTPQGKFGSM
jgi:hypothetical protein